MTTIFIGGSRAVSRLNALVRDRLDDFIRRQCMILIGDANGADKAVQRHLAGRGYQHVTVYCMEHCRNNLAIGPRGTSPRHRCARVSRTTQPRIWPWPAMPNAE